MLKDYRELCRQTAKLIPNWEELNRNELCRLCIENEDDPKMYNAYFAAILFNYAPTISKFYQSCNGLVTEEECIDWMEDAVIYALLHRRWEDPDSSIYNDPNGPDKVINRIMKCTRANLYQYVNRKKRKDSYKMKSLDEISEMVNDNSTELSDRDSYIDSMSIDLKSYIRKVFMEKDYFMAYMIDCIMNANVFLWDKDRKDNVFNIKKLSRVLCSLDDSYCIRFASDYDLEPGAVLKTLKYFNKMNSSKLLYKISYNIQKLKHDENFLKHLLGGRHAN